jgi:hypothetical protein
MRGRLPQVAWRFSRNELSGKAGAVQVALEERAAPALGIGRKRHVIALKETTIVHRGRLLHSAGGGFLSVSFDPFHTSERSGVRVTPSPSFAVNF